MSVSLSGAVKCEVSQIMRMGSASLREAVEALYKDSTFSPIESHAVMHAVCRRINEIPTDMRYWDLVSVVQVYAAKVPGELRDPVDLELVTKLIGGKLSHLSVKHLIDLLFAYEHLEIRPRQFYMNLCNRIIDLSGSSMYADELVALTRVLARTRFQSTAFIEAISKNIISNDSSQL